MKYNVKIAIPFYKTVYSILFVIVLAFVRGVSDVREIGAAMDANMALLAMVFCADGYYQEFSKGRWEVFWLCPSKRKWQTLLQRFFLQVIWLTIVAMVGYFVFYWQRPGRNGVTSELDLWLWFGFAVIGSIFFFGALSFTVVNLCNNLWAGLGISAICWSLLNSTTGQKLPDVLYVFAYGGKGTRFFDDSNEKWIWGKLSAVVLGCLLLFLGERKVKKAVWVPK
ncbi:MAG: ABC transporter permease [Roseburia sp.]|nr:ABC transporter permease [Roseburia sp.]MCM1277849.1 ABC transporter permease [Robinsoniella sp.]